MVPLLVFLGGGAGAVARWAVGLGWLRLIGTERPWGATLFINVFGGFLMGMLAAWVASKGGAATERWRLLLGTGALGGFTTFSTFSLEAGLMIERRDYLTAGGYVGASVAFSILGFFAGLMLARRLFA